MVGQKGINKLRADVIARGGLCVSTDTIREDHLIVAIDDLLHSYGIEHPFLPAITERRAAWGRMDLHSYEPCEEDCHLLEGLFEFMDTLAPEGFYFGAQEGDGACFGFWRVEEVEQ